ncbi:MAG: NAD(P)-dependent oxidoreductase [Candidatus Bipolaricaulia bacterium]
MTLTVYWPRKERPDAVELLENGLDTDVKLIWGPEPPERYDVLIAGRPDRDQLTGCPDLDALVIPFAGIPTSTRETLNDFPQLRVHNLHHNAEATAEMAIALLLAAAKKIVPLDRAFRTHDWRPRYAEFTSSMLLDGKRGLVLGYGGIGQRIARVLTALGVQVRAVCRRPERHRSTAKQAGIDVRASSELSSLWPRADMVMIALPQTPETEGLIGPEEIDQMPDHAILVNVGRAPIVDPAALYDALKDGRLGGAGLDVWYNYPKDEAERANTPPADYPFHQLENVVMSPHRAGGGDVIEERRMAQLAELLNALARGETDTNRVDLSAGY